MAVDGRIPLLIVSEHGALHDDIEPRRASGACLDMTPSGIDTGWMVYRRIPGRASVPWKHPGSCPCCAGQPPVAAALTQLFMERVRGDCPHFSFVVLRCDACSEASLRELLQQEVLVSARYGI